MCPSNMESCCQCYYCYSYCCPVLSLGAEGSSSSNSKGNISESGGRRRKMVCGGSGMLVLAAATLAMSVLLAASVNGQLHSGLRKREADYTLDDSFWNEESPVGEVERLLKEHQQNQELVEKIGRNSYQIIYPVQLRHHEKMGISTREVGAPKFPARGGFDSYSGSGGGRGRSRTGKHFHRTSLLIKAFNHKFRLDLELNTQLLAPNIVQKHYLPSGFAQDSHREIEHCYYHGTVKDYPGASAAFHTCNGVSGVIHVGNETFVIHPFYGGDLSKHPHVIFEARTKSNKGCANSGNTGGHRRDRQMRRQNHHSGLVVEQQDLNGAGRYRRDVREATKYIETALVIDKAMFQKRNGSTRAEVVHDAIQVANIADLYFRTINTRVSVVYIETWQGQNQAQIDGGKDISKAISNFNDYTTRNLYKIDKDTTQLLTGETFAGGEAGMSVPETVCTTKAVGISVDINTYEPHLLAGTMAHMIGHNIGMGHDDNREECVCRDWHGCIMSQSIVGLENVQPYKFSDCSHQDYIEALRYGHGLCLFNKPNEVVFRKNCGNGIVEEDEECDCGSALDCDKTDPCCDGITCKLKKESQCASGPCCDKCILKPPGVICRDAHNECDLPEYCNGESGQCPPDVYKKNGNPCGMNATGFTTGYCFNGLCPTTATQCERIWGYSGTGADRVCYEEYNSKGSINGHCGKDPSGNYIKCEPENIQCGSLHCKDGDKKPVEECQDNQYAKTIVSIKGIEYECKSISGTATDTPPFGLVRDGTPCGDNLICVNQSCVSIFPYIDQTKCPSNHHNMECSGNGDCTNTNKCFCKFGWTGPDCSIQAHITTTFASPVTTPASEVINEKMEKKTTRYANYHGSNTVFLVGVLMSVVGGVFVTFALMALCYRLTGTSASEEDPTHSGEEETVSFIDLPPNNTSKLPEKGILKKHGFGLMLVDSNKEKWPDDTQSDNLELIAQQESTIPPSGGQAGAAVVGPVPDGMKFVNGYHEDILEALRRSANQVPRSSANTPSGSFSEELLRKTLTDCVTNMQLNAPSVYPTERTRGSSSRTGSKENVCVPHPLLSDTAATSTLMQHHRQQQQHPQDEDDTPSVGPLRIRNLEDLIRQLEQHSSRHMSPNGSEDTRVSETEIERPCLYDPAKTFQMIQNVYRLKAKSTEYYENTANPSSVRHVFDEGMIWFMPERDADGAALCVIEVGKKWNTSKVSIIELIAAIRICVECALLDPETQLHGMKVIFDTEGLSMAQITQNTPRHAGMILEWVQKACPFRLQGVHVVNNSMLFNILFAIFKPFVSKELREKIFFHNRDWKSLAKQISPSCLRPKYGGSLPAPEYEGRLLGDFLQLYDKHFDTLDSYGYVDATSQRRSK